MTKAKPLWACPTCGAMYVSPNMWHSCGRLTPEEWLAGRGPHATALWSRLVEVMSTIGPFELHATKSRISFMVRVRFAGVSALSDRGMSLTFWLKEHITSPRFAKVEHVGRRDWIYRVRIATPEELDDEITEWLRRAYDVGRQQAGSGDP